MNEKKIVAIISGGLDSTCFLSQFEGDKIHALTFDYGQRNNKQEISRAKELLTELDREGSIDLEEHKIIDLNFMNKLYGDNQLTNKEKNVKEEYDENVVVPLRNAIFTTIAMSYAYSIGAEVVALGSHLDDAKAGPNFEPYYPDCTPEFYEVMTTALQLGHFRFYENKPFILTPSLIGQRLIDVVKIAYEKWGPEIFRTWSCYDGLEEQCGVCLSCRERRKTFEKLGIEDETKYLNNLK